MDRNLASTLDAAARAGGHVHLVGVGGVGMAGVAYLLARRGCRVSGCDSSGGGLADWLTAQGVEVRVGHDPSHVTPGLALVIRTPAVRADAPEVRRAAEAGVPVAARGQVLPLLLHGNPSVAVAGTHGKTTTSTFIAQVLRNAGREPTWCIGGVSEALGGVAGGAGSPDRPLVVEADESDGTLALYEPDIAVVTNIEPDHMEHFGSVEALRACFRTFAAQARRAVVYGADDSGARAVCGGLPGDVSFGFSPDATVRADILSETAAGTRFAALVRGKTVAEIALPVPGRHNVLNALAAVAALIEAGLTPAEIAAGLASVGLPRRRFERVGSGGGIEVISDYAHHPSEIAALVRAARGQGYRRILAVFQPHRYTRTLALGAEFPRAFAGVDTLVLAPVYAASEPPLPGGTTRDLYARFRENPAWGGKAGTAVFAADSLEAAWEYLRRELRPGDVLLVVGAGDVEKIAAWAAEALSRGAAVGPAGDLRVPEGLVSAATRVRYGEPLGSKTTFGVGGRADILADVDSEDDLRAMMRWARENRLPFRVLGGGSNVLVSDVGVRGVTVRLRGPAFGALGQQGSTVTAGGAVPLRRLLDWAEERGLAGLEFLEGIPGTVGGALRMNAGAHGGEIGALASRMRCLDAGGTVRVIERGAMELGYRRCDALRGAVLLDAELELTRDASERIHERRLEIARKREWFRGLHCAGSVFKNPPGDFAGRLIEAAGLKGLSVGGARICDEHANVIAAEPGATASDVRVLMELARLAVASRFGVNLESEIETI